MKKNRECSSTRLNLDIGDFCSDPVERVQWQTDMAKFNRTGTIRISPAIIGSSAALAL